MIMSVYYVILTLRSRVIWYFYDRENMNYKDVTSSIIFTEKGQKEIKEWKGQRKGANIKEMIPRSISAGSSTETSI
jgi:hypothetical protein